MKKNFFLKRSYNLVRQFILLLTLISTIETTAQAPAWQWAKSAAGNYTDWGTAISTDPGGNVLVTGFFQSASITLGTTTLLNASFGHTDIFVVKYDASGNILWAKSPGGIGDDYSKGISTDASGNVFVTGRFDSPSITFDNITLTNVGYDDIFVVKYDSSGNVLWAKSGGGTDYDEGNDIATDASGNVLITGYFKSDSISFGTTILTNANAGIADIFVLKYDATGNVLWAKSAGGNSHNYGNGISTDASGNVLVTGYFYSFSLTFGTTVLTNTGFADIFVVKYDASGNVVWATSTVGTSHDWGNDISTDASGNVLVTGGFQSASITFGTTTLTNASALSFDVFVVKYDASGNVLWAHSAGGIYEDSGYSISTDASGNVLLTGYFRSASITFGTTTLTNTSMGGVFDDIFVVKYDASGNVPWAKSAGGTYIDIGNGISTDAGGKVVVTGFFASDSISFGTTTLTNTSADDDIFIAKLDNITGLEENIKNEEVSIFPNPAKDDFTIKVTKEIKNGYVHVCNVLGENVSEEIISNESIKEIHLKNIFAGIYFVKVFDGEKQYTRKLIVEYY